jgi:hypothetical protein
LSVDIRSGDVPDWPYQLQVSWKGCPDLSLRDSAHQVLSFVSKARMLILDSQFGQTPRPEVVYVGVRPRPGHALSFNQTTTKNLTLTVSFGQSFASPLAVTQWALLLTFLCLFVLATLSVSWLIINPGVKRLHSATTLPLSSNLQGLPVAKRLGDRRTRGRAKAYLWMIVLGGLFYLLPSLETAGAEASGMLTSGNRDVCFFNEECMFPLQTFGEMFWFFVFSLHRKTNRSLWNCLVCCKQRDQQFGIHSHVDCNLFLDHVVQMEMGRKGGLICLVMIFFFF